VSETEIIDVIHLVFTMEPEMCQDGTNMP